ncbi:MAG: hypothetical protein E6I08_05965 [Chloroflexi bacterium]|nr:MAG: hypothetical protein E6I08_05965 [Chloroflexota bacterium]
MRKALAGGLLVILVACSTAGPKAPSGSPSSPAGAPAPTPTPSPAAEFSVALIDWDQNGTSYTLSLVSAAAKVLATAHASWTRGARCGPMQAGIIAPAPVSTSNHRAYYLDAGSIKWLEEDGKTGVALAGPLDLSASKAYGFAVAPDDSVVALNTIDYAQAPTLHQSLTITKVGAAALGSQIYRTTSGNTAAVWPVGWHKGNLVLAFHGGTCTQGGGPGLTDAWSYHVVDAQTADRKATIGTDTRACGLVGYPTPAGVPCGNYLETGGQPRTQVLDWSGASHSAFGAGFLPGGLSPDGKAYLGNTAGGSQYALTLLRAQGGGANVPVGDCFACGVMWIDNSHFLVAGNGAAPVKVFASTPEPLQGVSVAAQGFPAARVPGSLDGA